MSYAIAGKIAGYGLVPSWGMGDASSDYAQKLSAYQADHDAWLAEKARYAQAALAFQGQSAAAGANYGLAMSNYNRDLTAWNQEVTARAAAVAAASRQQLANQVAQSRANTAARAAGVVTPAGYPGCVTAAQHASWQGVCNTISTTVKGLGADPTGPYCSLALLPVCAAPVPMPAPLRPKPVPPAAPPALAPPAALRPEPLPPAPPPQMLPRPSSAGSPAPTPPIVNTHLGPAPLGPLTPGASAPTPSPTPPANKSAGLLKNGLLIVVLGGAGYALYRTFRKPKAAA